MSANLPSAGRRAVLLAGAGAAAGAGVVAGIPVLAQASADYGAPVIELCVPAGALTLEQKAAMVKGLTDVVLKAMGRTPDPARRCFVALMETAEGGFGVDGRVFAPKK